MNVSIHFSHSQNGPLGAFGQAGPRQDQRCVPARVHLLNTLHPQVSALNMAALCVQAYGLDPKFVEPIEISLKVIQGVYSGVTTAELDELAAQTGKQA